MKLLNTIQNCISNILHSAPFFVSKLVSVKHIVDNNIDTAATDGKNILYNESFFFSLSYKQQITLICHELCHIIFCHHLRMRGKDCQLWNVATDYAINLLLKSFGFEELPEWLYDIKYKGWSAEQIYNDIEKQSKADQDQLKNQSKQSGGEFEEPKDSNGNQLTQKDIDKELEQGATDLQKSINTISRALSGIENSKSLNQESKDKAKQNLGNGMNELINSLDDIKQSKVNWIEVIHSFLFSIGYADFNYSIPDVEQMAATGFYIPSIQSNEFGDILLALDISASLSHIAKQVASEAFHALEQVDKYELDVCYISDHIHKVKTINDINDIETIHGGGTCFRALFNNLLNDEEKYKGLIFVTDGHVYFNKWETPNIPVLWILTSANRWFEKNVPFGEVIRMLA